ncbi:MAG: RnfH family protein [Gammaproteobacteria bacterium]|nr:RnfH family protein [Gammaproteobacteria bacterium]
MHNIDVSVVYAEREQQWLKELVVARGTSAMELVQQSKLLEEVEALQGQAPEELSLGVFSQKVEHDYLLLEGDRVEIYRPLQADPKEVRRQLALIGKTMGKASAKKQGGAAS